MSSVVGYERRDSVGVITIDNPPVNAVSRPVRQGLLDALAQAAADAEAKSIVLIGAGRTFIAGADIREFGKPIEPPGLDTVIAAVETSAKPVIAAIHGTALGGGLEICLGCHYRVAVASAQVGLPEVKLGILPGAGGTQRLPRLIGAKEALEMITTGKFVRAAEAKALGIIDAIVAGDLLEGAVGFARSTNPSDALARRLRDRDDKLVDARGNKALFGDYRSQVKKRARGQESPLRCVDAVEAAVTLPFDEGLKREREIFLELVSSPQSRALVHAFFAEREAMSIPDVPADTATRPLKTAAVIGAGTMGGGIAMCFANAGIPVTLVETSAEALERGLGVIRGNYAATVAKGRLEQAAMDKRMGLIQGKLDLAAIRDADIVVEAVFENMALKQEVFRKLDGICRPGAIIATNTSTLDVDAIARVTKRPADVIGMHFFSPANVMRLLEVVRGAKTEKDVLATAMRLGKTLGKVPVAVGVCDGFVGNRMLFAYFREAEFLLEEGALPAQVDKALTDWGAAMGPFTMGDMAGNDVMWRVRQERRLRLANDRRLSSLVDRIAEAGRYGQKTNAGWYRYDPGSRTPISDPEVEKIILAESERLGIRRKTFSDDDILKRCLYSMINEGAKILEEGIAQRPGDIDVIYLTGYGFPSWRGGPMFHADTIGLDEILTLVKRMHESHGAWWQPAPLLEKLVREGKRFADLVPGKG
ncbi:MAG: enoyl-CoA hydratase/isomerase family protein [Proteobacteria bacterium]|nr:enoyl-CoA hydratase/isomerase family protein [Pseudomonadota bacterium]MBI3496247.1 enoyl-CoA hydratase/isomerase family protein [Pseudomonadota bacterium]